MRANIFGYCRSLAVAAAAVLLSWPVLGQAQPAPARADDIWTRNQLSGDWGGLRSGLDTAGVKLGLQEQSEIWGKLTGGLRTGLVYNGLTTAGLTLDLGKLAGWQGATVFADAFHIHGRGPSTNLIGNLQLVSNIEATRDTKLYDLWLEQKLAGDRLNVRIGQEGANDEMMISQYGALFLNSSFGFPGLPAADLPSGGPNYPMATPFARVKYQATDTLTVVGAVYNGDPAPPGAGDPQLRDAGGTAFRLFDRSLAFGELWVTPPSGSNGGWLPATYKIGAWYATSSFADQRFNTAGLPLANPLNSQIARRHSPGYAVYGVIDQTLWQQPGARAPDQGVNFFVRVMGAPSAFNLVDWYLDGGINWKAPWPGRDNDVLGLGVARLGISSAARGFSNDLIAFTGSGSRYRGNETVIEATYSFQATPWLALQPDAQLVLNPGAAIPTAAAPTPLKDAFVVGVRATIVF